VGKGERGGGGEWGTVSIFIVFLRERNRNRKDRRKEGIDSTGGVRGGGKLTQVNSIEKKRGQRPGVPEGGEGGEGGDRAQNR